MVYKVVNTKTVREARLNEELVELEKIQNKIINPDAGDVEEEILPQNSANPDDKTDWKKRHSDLRSFTQKEINDLKKELGVLKIQLTDAATKQIKFPKTEEEVTEWVQKYPDVAAIVETIAMKKVADVRKEVEDHKASLAEDRYQVEFNRNVNRIFAAHSDFSEVRDNEDFIEWLQKQPKYVRTAFSDDPVAFDDLEDIADTVVNTIELYKAKFHTKKQKPSDDRREAAKGVVKSGSSAPNERPENTFLASEIDAMSAKEYDKHEEAIMKAFAEGRIINDVERSR